MKLSQEALPKLFVRRREHFTTSDDHRDIHRLREFWSAKTDQFVETTTDSVATHGGFMDLLADDHREARVLTMRVSNCLDCKIPRTSNASVLVEKLEASVAMKSVSSGNHIFSSIPKPPFCSSAGGDGGWLDGDTSAAFDAATLEDRTARLG